MNPPRFLPALLLLGTLAAAPAAVTSALGIAGNTNVFIIGNADAPYGGQAQGSVVVQGNFSGTNYDVRLVKGTSTPGSPIPENADLYIGGNDTVDGGQGNEAAVRANSGDIYIGGAYTNENLVAKNGNIYNKSFDLAPTVENLVKLSSELAKMDSVAISLDPKEVSVKVDLDQNTVNGKGLKVYTVDGSMLGSINNLSFSGGTGGETIVVNVLGHTVDWGLSTNSADDGRILWNFVDQASGEKGDDSAQTLNINTMFKGTILAPAADVNQNANINGTLIANNWNIGKNATMMDGKFTGEINLVSAPEPAGLLTMGGFLGLALFSRRRSAGGL
ncbi:MAG: Choice-of-anchor domain containing protein [Verrucomicrobiales bacterium]|nr:Choice-of-anchor domain containing protein [Verrucomicrobiales bacterium]